MAGFFGKFLLWVFVDKRNRAKAEAVLRKRAPEQQADRATLIRQAMATRRAREHLWTDLSEDEQERLLTELGDGMRDQITAMKGARKHAG